MLINYIPYDLRVRPSLNLRLVDSTADVSSKNQTPVAGDTSPTANNGYLQFSGTQNLRYAPSVDWHADSPYSVEFDVYLDPATVTSKKIIATVGETGSTKSPEWTISYTANQIVFTSFTVNKKLSYSSSMVTNYNTKRWYRIGIMFYGGRAYGFVNETQVFDIMCPYPYDSGSNLVFGGDTLKTPEYQFVGRLRNITVGKSAFWIPAGGLPAIDPANPPSFYTLSGSVGTFGELQTISLPIITTDPENNIVSYQITNGALPPGLDLNPTTGVIYGTIGSVTADSVFEFTIKATDRTNLAVSGTFSINVVNASTVVTWITSNQNPIADIAPGQPINITLLATSE